MTEQSADFAFETGKASLVTLDRFGVSLEAQATLICEYGNDIAEVKSANIMAAYTFAALVEHDLSEATTGTYPSAYSCLSLVVTHKSHHCQSVACLENIFPDEVLIRVES